MIMEMVSGQFIHTMEDIDESVKDSIVRGELDTSFKQQQR